VWMQFVHNVRRSCVRREGCLCYGWAVVMHLTLWCWCCCFCQGSAALPARSATHPGALSQW
jgi:hypothetical protein